MKTVFKIILSIAFILILYYVEMNIPKTKVLASTKVVKKIKHNYCHTKFNISTLTVEKMQSTIMHEMFHNFKNFNFIQYDIPYASAIGFYVEMNDTKFITSKEHQNAFNAGLKSDFNKIDSLIDNISEQYRNINQTETKQSYVHGAFMAGLLKQKYPNFETKEAFGCLMCLGLGMDSKSCEILLENDAVSYIFHMKSGEYNKFNNKQFLIDTKDLSNTVKNILNNYKIILQDFCVVITKDNVGDCLTPNKIPTFP